MSETKVTADNYVENVLRTESCDMEPIMERLRDEELAAVLTNAMAEVTHAADVIDMVKKCVFYGKENALLTHMLDGAEFDDLSSEGETTRDRIFARLIDPRNIRMMHAAVGMATEAGELMEMLRKHIMFGAEFDEVNAAEEIGDSMWYQGVAMDVLGTTPQQIMQMNIDKLRKRFPTKFSEDAAINRDVEAERELLQDATKAVNIKMDERVVHETELTPLYPSEEDSE